MCNEKSNENFYDDWIFVGKMNLQLFLFYKCDLCRTVGHTPER